MNRINFFKNKYDCENDCNNDCHQPEDCYIDNHPSKDCCDKTDDCSCCPKCPPGPPGTRGPRGPMGETGPAGPQGEAGGVLNYADFYALMPPDNSATVAPGTDVSFPQDGPNSLPEEQDLFLRTLLLRKLVEVILREIFSIK